MWRQILSTRIHIYDKVNVAVMIFLLLLHGIQNMTQTHLLCSSGKVKRGGGIKRAWCSYIGTEAKNWLSSTVSYVNAGDIYYQSMRKIYILYCMFLCISIEKRNNKKKTVLFYSLSGRYLCRCRSSSFLSLVLFPRDRERGMENRHSGRCASYKYQLRKCIWELTCTPYYVKHLSLSLSLYCVSSRLIYTPSEWSLFSSLSLDLPFSSSFFFFWKLGFSVEFVYDKV